MSNTNEGGHADELFEGMEYELPAPPPSKTEFLPWHRPRKQYVREVQWCADIDRLVASSTSKQDKLKYLGLPGMDLLDLRYIHSKVCIPHEVPLHFLGFNSSARPNSKNGIELNISLDEVRRLNWIDPKSDVIGDNFSRLANVNSVAYKRALAAGPFDVINLDLCDGFANQDPENIDETYYQAVANLFGIQSRASRPWVLFLTTRTDRQNIDIRVLTLLIKKYCSNLSSSEDFRKASDTEFSIATNDAVHAAVESAKGLVDVFVTALCKWFLGLALEGNPPTKVELLSAFGYQVEPAADCEDLISISLKFTPTFKAVADPLGLAKADATSDLNEGLLASKALKRIAKRVNADQRLQSDAILREQVTTDSENLLQLARYDVSGYREWIEK